MKAIQYLSMLRACLSSAILWDDGLKGSTPPSTKGDPKMKDKSSSLEKSWLP